jgi:hypothetical protein
MIEIKNKERGPVQLVVRSGLRPRSFTTLIIPGIGAGKNVRYIEDEKMTEYVERAEKKGHITTRYIPNNKLKKGD